MSSNRKLKTVIIITGAMIKYPWGGIMQWVLAWIVGLKNLGYDVFYLEEVEWEYSCYDVSKKMMTSNPSYGINMVKRELKKYNLEDNYCFKDNDKSFHGLTKNRVLEVFKTADVFIDLEFNSWESYSELVPLRVYVDPEPGWNQMGIQKMLDIGEQMPKYHAFFTHGFNVGTDKSPVPTIGIQWKRMFVPILLDKPFNIASNHSATVTTIMQWKANKTIIFKGKTYGMKDVEFQKFMELPRLVNDRMEIAVSGPNVPKEMLRKNGWIVKNADDISTSINNYRKYIANSKAEFSVAKNAHVETKCGVFLERSGYYMFSNKPVVLQDTGWSDYVPTGRGLFAVKNVEEAADAINKINSDYKNHCKWANEIVHEYMDAEKVLINFIAQLA